MAQFIENLYHGTSNLHEGVLHIPLFVTVDKEYARWFSVENLDDNNKSVLLKGNLVVDNILDITKNYEIIDELLLTLGIEFKRQPYFNCDKISEHSPYDGTNDSDIFYIPEVQQEVLKRGFSAIKLLDCFLNSEALTYIVLDNKSYHLSSVAKVSMENDEVIVSEDMSVEEFKETLIGSLTGKVLKLK